MRRLIGNVSNRAEFWLVLAIGFGLLIASSVFLLVTRRPLIISNRNLLASVALEFAILGLVAWIGRVRGWSFRSLGLRPTWRLTAGGVIFFLGVALTGAVLIAAARFFGWELPHPSIIVFGISPAAIIAVCIVNPIFEETLVTGYIIQRFPYGHGRSAVIVSAFFRFLYHTYLGPGAALVLLIGLLFGLIFWRYRELWPLIIAHAFMDLVLFLSIGTAA